MEPDKLKLEEAANNIAIATNKDQHEIKSIIESIINFKHFNPNCILINPKDYKRFKRSKLPVKGRYKSLLIK